MADIRIKDLASTATTTASDDFMAVDGTTNGTRKLSAATPAFLTSVTTPSLTSPASTALTLGTTDSGTAITVLSASNNVGIGTASPGAKLDIVQTGAEAALRVYNSQAVDPFGLLVDNTAATSADANYIADFRLAGTSVLSVRNTGKVGIGTNAPTSKLDVSDSSDANLPIVSIRNISVNGYSPQLNFDTYGYAGSTPAMFSVLNVIAEYSGASPSGGSVTFKTKLQPESTAIEALKLKGNGDVLLASTTAGSANAGALVLQGGISAGNTGSAASYFGGGVTVSGNLDVSGSIATNTNMVLNAYTGAGNIILKTNSIAALTLSSAQAATFAGAVTAAGTIRSNTQEGFKIAAAAGYYAGYESNGTTLNGFIQFTNANGLNITNSIGGQPINFVTGGVQRATIDDIGGNLVVGASTTSAYFDSKINAFSPDTYSAIGGKQGNSSAAVMLQWNAGTTGDNIFTYFITETGATIRGTISYNRAGGLVAYNTTSDYRAKDISGPVTGSGALIDSIPVYMGKMHGATQERPMFIAHETPDYAHTGKKDAVDADGNPKYQQMDASALIPVMWAELQSLRKRLAALEAK